MASMTAMAANAAAHRRSPMASRSSWARSWRAHSFVLPALLSLLLVAQTPCEAQVVGQDVCACTPTIINIFADLGSTCDQSLVGSHGINAMQCSSMSFRTGSQGAVPVEITSIQILELDAQQSKIKEDIIMRTLVNGQGVAYESVASDSLILGSSRVPGGLQLIVRGITASQQQIQSISTISYDVDCNNLPFRDRSINLNWVRLEEGSPPLTDSCPKAILPPSPAPTRIPTIRPTSNPTRNPTASPTSRPTSRPTSMPTLLPTSRPTSAPTSIPTSNPTSNPTASPTGKPTSTPTATPTSRPTIRPTTGVADATLTPTGKPTVAATSNPASNATISSPDTSTSPSAVNASLAPSESPSIGTTLAARANNDSPATSTWEVRWWRNACVFLTAIPTLVLYAA